MTDPQVIQDDVIRGNSFLNNLIHNEILADQSGISKNNCDVDSECLLFILKALQFRLDQEKYDKKTEKLYRDLILIIGDYTQPSTIRFYYGTKDTDTLLTNSEILASSYIETSSGSNPVIPYASVNTPKYYWMAELLTEPVKTKWQDTVVSFNNGNIGTSVDTFGPTVTVNSFRFYDTEFATQFDYPVQFKV